MLSYDFIQFKIFLKVKIYNCHLMLLGELDVVQYQQE